MDHFSRTSRTLPFVYSSSVHLVPFCILNRESIGNFSPYLGSPFLTTSIQRNLQSREGALTAGHVIPSECDFIHVRQRRADNNVTLNVSSDDLEDKRGGEKDGSSSETTAAWWHWISDIPWWCLVGPTYERPRGTTTMPINQNALTQILEFKKRMETDLSGPRHLGQYFVRPAWLRQTRTQRSFRVSWMVDNSLHNRRGSGQFYLCSGRKRGHIDAQGPSPSTVVLYHWRLSAWRQRMSARG